MKKIKIVAFLYAVIIAITFATNVYLGATNNAIFDKFLNYSTLALIAYGIVGGLYVLRKLDKMGKFKEFFGL